MPPILHIDRACHPLEGHHAHDYSTHCLDIPSQIFAQPTYQHAAVLSALHTGNTKDGTISAYRNMLDNFTHLLHSTDVQLCIYLVNIDSMPPARQPGEFFAVFSEPRPCTQRDTYLTTLCLVSVCLQAHCCSNVQRQHRSLQLPSWLLNRQAWSCAPERETE